jgi:SNF2 family DNA or RNA helicase
MSKVTQKLKKFNNWLKTAGLSEKKHQLDGVKWCLERETQILDGVLGGLVADEMGLGKTILMLGLIVANFQKSGTIIIVPPALLDQWVVEIGRLFGHAPTIYHGKHLKTTKQDLINDEPIPIMITTYGIIMSRKESDPIFTRTWGRMICDEAHHMRNRKGVLFLKMPLVKASIKWLVTGTPIQNKANDLLSLCMVMGLRQAMLKQPEQAKQIILNHSLRRTKKEIGLKLPPIKYHIVDVEWMSDEERIFAASIHSYLGFPKITLKNVNRVMALLDGGSPLPWLTRARQSCIFPHLLQKNIQKLIDEGLVDEDNNMAHIKTTSKINAIVKTLIKRKVNNRRKLVFCHYHGEIDILSSLLKKFGITSSIIDGRQSNTHKKFATQKVLSFSDYNSVCKKWRNYQYTYKLIADFMAPEVCLCQIQTASEGLNLQHFQEIYFTSPWWNPALEDQAIARAHRIGQTQKVDVFRFAMKNFGGESKTLDQYCLEVQKKKRAIVQNFGFN